MRCEAAESVAVGVGEVDEEAGELRAGVQVDELDDVLLPRVVVVGRGRWGGHDR